MNRPLLILLAAAAGFFGFQMGEGPLTQAKEPVRIKVHPEREFPLAQYHSFAFIVYASNQAAWCERTLASIFAQDYDYYRVIFIDDASTDGTSDVAHNFIVDNHQVDRVILIRNEKRLGPCASLYRAAESCSDREVAIPLEAKDWLTHEGVLTRLNGAFQNPDVWIASSSAISYPQYEMDCPGGLNAFYAGLLKQVHLEDLFSAEGVLSLSRDSYLKPLTAMAGGRIRSISEPLSFANLAGFSPEQKAPSFAALRTDYEPLASFPSSATTVKRADLLVFSYDRPLQLYATLESALRYLSGLERCTVLYRASDERYARGYGEVQAAFPAVRFIRQSSKPHKDFQPLVLEAVFNSPSEYILFGVDDLIVTDFVDLKMCMSQMERTKAYGFYLRLGSNITHCYMIDKPQPVPPMLPLGNGLFAWDKQAAQDDWAFFNTLDMTLYRKSDIKEAFEKLKYKHPNRLEWSWAQNPSKNPIGLCFETSKIVNLPLNIVNPSDCRHSHFMTVEEMLVKWSEGSKIDIDPLFRIENVSPHIDFTPDFVAR
ncbi:MAG: glycosyltransferase family 2 protein [Verrucomicrobia bacterium]|nr:glycosyltransferase family 2 protein [Verrucomicrobiota bacterium]